MLFKSSQEAPSGPLAPLAAAGFLDPGPPRPGGGVPWAIFSIFGVLNRFPGQGKFGPNFTISGPKRADEPETARFHSIRPCRPLKASRPWAVKAAGALRVWTGKPLKACGWEPGRRLGSCYCAVDQEKAVFQ